MKPVGQPAQGDKRNEQEGATERLPRDAEKTVTRSPNNKMVGGTGKTYQTK